MAQPSAPVYSLRSDQEAVLSLRDIHLRQLQSRLRFAFWYAELSRFGGLDGWVLRVAQPEPDPEPDTDEDIE